jgi:MFS family permease
VNGISIWVDTIDPGHATLITSHPSLIVSIFSAGTFFDAVIAGDVAEWTVIYGCAIHAIGIIIQMLPGIGGNALGIIAAGRLIAGIGVGFESAIVILYMSEIVSRLCLRIDDILSDVLTSCLYQFCVAIGLMLASCVVYGT